VSWFYGSGPNVRQTVFVRVLAAALLTFAPCALAGQASPRTLTGLVTDSAGQPLVNAVVALDPNEAVRATRTNAQGRFRFEGVNPGQYQLRVTWVGYVPDDRTIAVPREGLELTIALAKLPFQLDTMTIIAQRGGIIGTAVQRSDFRALGGVDVEILGSRHRLKTEADGRFVFDVREGSYVLLGRRNGFESRMLPVPVPPAGAVEVAMALDSAPTKAQRIHNNRILDMQMRWRRASTSGSAIVGRHELLPSGKQSLELALRYSPSFLHKAMIWEGVECVYVDGIARPNMLARDFSADQVEMVEVYNYYGGTNARDQALFRRNGNECGVGPVEERFETGRGAFRTYRRPKPGTVAIVHIWLKK
jgi:hypothetical protein